LLIFGAVDWITWGYPFHSFIELVLVNAVEGKANYYGTHPIYWYLSTECFVWMAIAPVILFLVWPRARASMVWIGFAAIVIATHSLLPHKEYRFTYPAFCALVVVAAMGSADYTQDARSKLSHRARALLTAAVALLWLIASAELSLSPTFRPLWTQSRGRLLSAYWLARQPNLCGLLLYDDRWDSTGGYAYLHRDIPIYSMTDRRAQARRSTAAYNFILLHRGSIADFQGGYKVANCFGRGAADDVCVMERAGPCRQDPALRPLLMQTGLGAPWLRDRGRRANAESDLTTAGAAP
jgi:hypothetical protein